MFGINFFPIESVDKYPGVLVPLEQARRRKTSKVLTETTSDVSPEKKGSGITDTEKANSLNHKNDTDYHTIESLQAEVLAEMKAGGLNTAYDMKSIIINKAIQDVGMGRYNWSLFILCGFGWLADNIWLQQLALTLPAFSEEFGISENRIRYTTCFLSVGLCIGAAFWGIGCDIMGRRMAFNLTLMISGVFGVLLGASPSWTSICVLNLIVGFGIGGNLPVDGALFLEFLPNASGNLLTLLSVWWSLGSLVVSLIAWGYMGGSFPPDKAWRYFLYTMGALTFFMFLMRFFVFHLLESPKYLLSQGRQPEAVAVVHGLAYRNKTTTWLTEDLLNKIGGHPEVAPVEVLSTGQIIRRKISSFSTKRINPLFETRELGRSTVLLWLCWLAIGIGYPLFNCFLPQYLSGGKSSSGEQVSSYQTYRNLAITSATGAPGSILASYLVNVRYIGRKGTMAISTLLCGIMIFLFTTSRTSSSQLLFSALESFFQNAMYGTMYAYTPEIFPAPVRGTGTGISSLLNRIGGLSAPLIAANTPPGNSTIPIMISGAMILFSAFAMLFLSVETRDRQII